MAIALSKNGGVDCHLGNDVDWRNWARMPIDGESQTCLDLTQVKIPRSFDSRAARRFYYEARVIAARPLKSVVRFSQAIGRRESAAEIEHITNEDRTAIASSTSTKGEKISDRVNASLIAIGFFKDMIAISRFLRYCFERRICNANPVDASTSANRHI